MPICVLHRRQVKIKFSLARVFIIEREMPMRYCLTVFAVPPLLAQETILLQPGAKVDPSAAKEQVEERGKDGVVNRSITHGMGPSVTVYR